MSDEDDEQREYASPPCFMHKLVPEYRAESAQRDTWTDIARWRKAERNRLIDAQLAVDVEGGSFFDRTLVAMSKRPHVIGIGHAESRIPTIYPQPQDIPMDVIITDE